MGEKDVDRSRYRMPAEWEPHEGTWLQWPQDRIYRGYELKLEGIWLAMVRALHQHEKVHLIVASERQRDHVASQLEYFSIGLENVFFYIIPQMMSGRGTMARSLSLAGMVRLLSPTGSSMAGASVSPMTWTTGSR